MLLITTDRTTDSAVLQNSSNRAHMMQKPPLSTQLQTETSLRIYLHIQAHSSIISMDRRWKHSKSPTRMLEAKVQRRSTLPPQARAWMNCETPITKRQTCHDSTFIGHLWSANPQRERQQWLLLGEENWESYSITGRILQIVCEIIQNG